MKYNAAAVKCSVHRKNMCVYGGPLVGGQYVYGGHWAVGTHYLGQPDWSPGLVGYGGRETWKHIKMTFDPTFHNLASLFNIRQEVGKFLKHLIDGYHPPFASWQMHGLPL